MGKIAFVFSGQGAQYPGMGKDLYENIQSAKEVFDIADEKTKNMCFFGSKEDLFKTINTQPCLFLMDLACAISLNEKGIYANSVAGFSLGEIPALAYSKILTNKEAYDLVCFRAKVMHECALKNKGSMFAILKLKKEKIEEICSNISLAYPVNYNCEGQTVVAVDEKSEDVLIKMVGESGGRALKLNVSGAFHSPFMNEASEEIFGYLEDKKLAKMEVPIYSNYTSKIYLGDEKLLISKQVNNPVLWQATIQNMIDDGIDTFIEVGAGKVLSGLIKKINKDVRIYNVEDLSTLLKTVDEVKKC